MHKRMGQTAEDIRDNIVKIADENGNCIGTGFFIHKEYCVTCHHNICGLNEIYVEREEDNIGGKQQRKRRYPAEWVEQFSDMQKDIAFLKVNGADFKPLEYRRETDGKIPVIVRGFPLQELYNFPDGKDERGTLRHTLERFRWKEEEIIVEVQDKWNIKPEVNVQVYAFNGKFSVGFSGAPVCYEHDWKVVGMFEAKDDNQGYIIPMSVVVGTFALDQKTKKISAPSPTLDARKILDTGNEYYYNREYAKAIEQYEMVINDPNYATVWSNKGSALSHLSKHNEAIKCYDRVIEIKPKYSGAWYNKGTSLIYLGKYQEAIKCLEKVLELMPDHVDAWSNKGSALLNLGKYEEAIVCFDKALESEPNDAYTLTNKCSALSRLGKPEEAIKYCDKALDIDPNLSITLTERGSALSHLSKHDEAIKYYDKALDIDPNLSLAWNNKGFALLNSGRYQEAIVYYDKVLELMPDDASAWYNRACSKVKKGDIEDGLADLKRAIGIDKNYIELAKQDKDFGSIRNDERFKALVML